MNGLAMERAYVDLSDEDFRALSDFIETRLGIKMPPAKKQLLEARLQKRLRFLGVSSFSAYRNILFDSEDSSRELIAFIDEVTTNKTEFYRDPDHFDFFGRLLRDRTRSRSSVPAKIWSVAASSGEEPYTIAMVCEEYRREEPSFEYEVTGTDIATAMLRKAIRGIYPRESINGIPADQRTRYLLKGKSDRNLEVRFIPAIRNRTRFYRLNLMDEDYRIRQEFDYVFCRNVLIYFDKENQERIMRRVYSQMSPGAYLFMGPTEGMLAGGFPLSKVSSNVFQKEVRDHG